MFARRAVLFCALIPLAAASWAQKSGGAPEQLGKVSFANSCLPAAQPVFERGVALLHSFWFSQSERAFQEIVRGIAIEQCSHTGALRFQVRVANDD